jgi:hypothetical protein
MVSLFALRKEIRINRNGVDSIIRMKKKQIKTIYDVS